MFENLLGSRFVVYGHFEKLVQVDRMFRPLVRVPHHRLQSQDPLNQGLNVQVRILSEKSVLKLKATLRADAVAQR